MTQDAQPKEEVTFDTFAQLDIRTGTIMEARPLKGARVPAYRLKVDFGPVIGIKQSSAQITDLYTPEGLIGEQVLGVVNFPPMHIAGWRSEVLVLGVYTEQGVVLIAPKQKTDNGIVLG